MTEKEYDVKMAELHVKSQRLNARVCKLEMEEGFKRLQARLTERYECLKAAYEQSLIDLEEAELSLTNYKQAAEKNFD
jgi:hypothetical protein